MLKGWAVAPEPHFLEAPPSGAGCHTGGWEHRCSQAARTSHRPAGPPAQDEGSCRNGLCLPPTCHLCPPPPPHSSPFKPWFVSSASGWGIGPNGELTGWADDGPRPGKPHTLLLLVPRPRVVPSPLPFGGLRPGRSLVARGSQGIFHLPCWGTQQAPRGRPLRRRWGKPCDQPLVGSVRRRKGQGPPCCV